MKAAEVEKESRKKLIDTLKIQIFQVLEALELLKNNGSKSPGHVKLDMDYRQMGLACLEMYQYVLSNTVYENCVLLLQCFCFFQKGQDMESKAFKKAFKGGMCTLPGGLGRILTLCQQWMKNIRE